MSAASGRTLDRSIFQLAFPALGTLAADPLVSLIDTAFVGRLGKVPLAALGVATAVFSVAFFLFNFLAYGTTPLVAGAVARDDKRHAGRVATAAIGFGLLVGLATTLVLEAAAEPVVRAMGAEAGLLAEAAIYLRIRVLGMPAVLVATVAHGVFRGYQDTRTPMMVTLGISLLNLVLDPVFIFGFGWNLAGAAWATMIAQWTGAAIFAAMFFERRRLWALEWTWPGTEALRPLVGAGRALVVRSGALLGAFTLATAVATRQGEDVVAAHQVAFQLWVFLALVVDALAIAGQALIGLHRDDLTVAAAYARRLLAWGVVAGLILMAAMFAGWSTLPRLFTGDQEVISQLGAVYGFIVVMQPLNAVVFVWDGIAIGASEFVFLAASTTLAAATTAVILGFVQVQAWGLRGIWWALVAMMIARLGSLLWWQLRGPLSNGRGPSRESPAAA